MKIIFCDIDGTFCTRELKVPDINKQAVLDFEKTGDRFVLISGRSASQIEMLLEEYQFDCDYIFSNGSGYRLQGQEAVYNHIIAKDDYLPIKTILEKYEVFYHLHTNQGIFVQNQEVIDRFYHQFTALFYDQEPIWQGLLDFKYDYFTNQCHHCDFPLETIFNNPQIILTKIELLDADDNKMNEISNTLEKMGFLCFQSSYRNLEIVNPKSNKGTAILEYNQRFLPERTYGFGDASNDLPMFEVVDVAIAVQNADGKLKQKATHITQSCDEGGVGQFINQYILNK